jgi:putative glutamine amidotransferase
VNFANAVRKAGGLPVVLSPENLKDIETAEKNYPDLALEYMRRLDGLLLTGGGDIVEYKDKPTGLEDLLFTMDKLRDLWEFALLSAAHKLERPILGVCRGVQVMNRFYGGTLRRDIETEVEGAVSHRQRTSRENPSHSVRIEKGSKIYKIFRLEEIEVNSGHHQAAKEPGKDFLVTGRAPDGVIESMEHREHPFALGVQWHPEGMFQVSKEQLALFKAFLKAAAGKK